MQQRAASKQAGKSRCPVRRPHTPDPRCVLPVVFPALFHGHGEGRRAPDDRTVFTAGPGPAAAGGGSLGSPSAGHARSQGVWRVPWAYGRECDGRREPPQRRAHGPRGVPLDRVGRTHGSPHKVASGAGMVVVRLLAAVGNALRGRHAGRRRGQEEMVVASTSLGHAVMWSYLDCRWSCEACHSRTFTFPSLESTA